MKKRNGIKIAMIAVGLVLLMGLISFPTFSEEKKDWSRLFFASHTGGMRFFDPETGIIYSYSETTGRARGIWVLEELGKDLRKVR